jgi:hypothetical protein
MDVYRWENLLAGVVRKLVQSTKSIRNEGNVNLGSIVAFFTSHPTYKNTVMD